MGGEWDLLTEPLLGIEQLFCLLCAEKRVEECHQKQIADTFVGHYGMVMEHLEAEQGVREGSRFVK